MTAPDLRGVTAEIEWLPAFTGRRLHALDATTAEHERATAGVLGRWQKAEAMCGMFVFVFGVHPVGWETGTRHCQHCQRLVRQETGVTP